MGRKPSSTGAQDRSKHLKQTVTCMHPDCGRKFGRRDHLRRHELTRESHEYMQALKQEYTDARQSQTPHHGVLDTSALPAPTSSVGDQVRPPISDVPLIQPSDLYLHDESAWHTDSAAVDPSALHFDWDAFVASIIEPPVSPFNLVFFDQSSAQLPLDNPSDHFLPPPVDIDPCLVDATVSERVLEAFPILRPLSTSSASSDVLSKALSAYWRSFDPQFPIIHKSSFDPRTASVEQLAAMISIGQYQLLPRQSHFINIPSTIRGRLLIGLSPDTKLVDLQTLLLCHMHDEWMSTSTANYQAQCFSSTLTAVLRRRSLLVRYTWSDFQGHHDVEGQWRTWIEDESAVRLAYGLMMADSELPAYWGQVSSRRHSPLLLQLRLPDASQAWSAEDATTWQSAMSSGSRKRFDQAGIDHDFVPAVHLPYEPRKALPGYSSSLKSVLDGRGDLNDCRSIWNRLVLLHGLNMLIWDIKLHGSVSLIGRVSFNWRQSLHYAMLKLDDIASYGVEYSLATRYFHDSMTLSMISLFADFTNLQIFAGAKSMGGCTISEGQKQSAKAKLGHWILGTEGKAALFHAATYLQETYSENLLSDPSIISAWAVYMCTLVCWAMISLQAPLKAIEREIPAQLVIPQALDFLEGISREDKRYTGERASVGIHAVLSAAEFFLGEQAAGWGIALEAVDVLRGIRGNSF